MSFFDALRYRWRVLTHPRQHGQDVNEEMAHHLGLEAMQNSHAGAPTETEAHAAARRRFGNATYLAEEVRRVAGLGFFDVLAQDLRFALRTFRRTPGFTAVAVTTLALGIGANTAIFSAVDALLLRPLPFHEPDRLMSVGLTIPADGVSPAREDLTWSWPRFGVFRQTQTVYSDLSLWFGSGFTLRVGDESVRDFGEFTDSRYLHTLGIEPLLGRSFAPEEDVADGPRVAIIGHGLWTLLFNADPAILERTIAVDGTPYTIVGVAPPGLRGLSGQASIWIPFVSPPFAWGAEAGLLDLGNHRYFAVGRLKPGVTVAQAKALVPSFGNRVRAAFPERMEYSAATRELDSARVDGRIRTTLLVLAGAVGVVLLIACANVANLFLVRAAGRRREIAVRLAIGAGRRRLVRQLMAESLLLSGMGGVAGLALAWWGVRALASLDPASVMRLQNVAGLGAVNSSAIRLDLTALAFTGALVILTGILFGLVPALQATRPSLTEALKEASGPRRGRIRRLSSRNVLVVVEIALAVVLLAGSGLMLRSLGHLLGIRTGFDPGNVLTMRVNRAPEWSRDSITTFYDRAIHHLRSVPGAVDVGMIDCPPLQGCANTRVRPHDRPPPANGADELVAGVHWITPGLPSLLGIPLIRGRMLTEADRLGAQKVVLVSETAARRFWPGRDAVGQPISVNVDGFSTDTAYVAGVIGDVRYGPMDLPPGPEVYVSYFQAPLSFRMMLFLRTRGDPAALVAPVRQAMREVAPGFPVYDVSTMESRIGDALAYARLSALLLALFAGLALALAAIGTYGVISFAVAQRRQEIGVRIALGATREDVVGMVVRQGFWLATAGAACGLTAAVTVTRVLRSMLYEVEPTDPLTLAGILGVLAIAVLAASWIPARRAAGVSPLQALKGG